jgi:hypothetical protein
MERPHANAAESEFNWQICFAYYSTQIACARGNEFTGHGIRNDDSLPNRVECRMRTLLEHGADGFHALRIHADVRGKMSALTGLYIAISIGHYMVNTGDRALGCGQATFNDDLPRSILRALFVVSQSPL